MEKKTFIINTLSIILFSISFIGCDSSSSQDISKKDDVVSAIISYNHNQLSKIMTIKSRAFQDDEEEAQSIAEELDNNMIDFINRYGEYLRGYMPDVVLSDDELNVMSLDKDKLDTFLSANFSDDFCDIVNNIRSGTNHYTIEEIEHYNAFNPLELSIIANMIVSSEYEEYVGDIIEEETTVDENMTKAECYEMYSDETDECWDTFATGLTVAGFSGFFRSNVYVYVGMYAVAFVTYVGCNKTARVNRDKCLRKANR